jgi:hypothetical protein
MEAVLQIDPDLISFIWSRPIGDTRDIEINFDIVATKAPSNHLTSSGRAGNDPSSLDVHEFDGWIVIEYQPTKDNPETEQKEISLPFYSIIRQASDLMLLSQPIWPTFDDSERMLEVDLFNNGVGTAQIDVFELLYVSSDDPEVEAGSDRPNADFNYIGFRSLPSSQENCDFVLEFAFHLWEKHKRLAETQLQVYFDLDRDGIVDYTLANRGPEHQVTEFSDCRIRSGDNWEWSCTGFVPDHSVDTATTILRACSNDLGIGKLPQIIDISFASFGRSDKDIESDTSPTIQMQVPMARISGPSYDVPGGSMLTDIQVQIDNDLASSSLLGLLLITNAWRSRSRTGAATPRSEAIVLPIGDLSLPKEMTSDTYNFPKATNFSGPNAISWYTVPETCDYAQRRALLHGSSKFIPAKITDQQQAERKLQVCPENDIPRSSVRVARQGIVTSEIGKSTPVPSGKGEESVGSISPTPASNKTSAPTSKAESLDKTVYASASSPYPLSQQNTIYVKKTGSHSQPLLVSSSAGERYPFGVVISSFILPVFWVLELHMYICGVPLS